MRLFEDYIEDIESNDIVSSSDVETGIESDTGEYKYVFIIEIENESYNPNLEKQIRAIKKIVENILSRTPQINEHSSVDYIVNSMMFPEMDIIKNVPSEDEVAATWQASAYNLRLRFFADCHFGSFLSVVNFASNIQQACKKYDNSQRKWNYHPLMYSRNVTDSKGHWHSIGTNDKRSIKETLDTLNAKKKLDSDNIRMLCSLFTDSYSLIDKPWEIVYADFVRIVGTDFSKTFMDAAFKEALKRCYDKHRTGVKLPKLFVDYASTHPVHVPKDKKYLNFYNCTIAYTNSPEHISREGFLRSNNEPYTIIQDVLDKGTVMNGVFDVRLIEGRIDYYFGIYLGVIPEDAEYGRFIHVCVYFKDTLTFEENVKSICSVFGKKPGEDADCDLAAKTLVNAMFEIANKD